MSNDNDDGFDMESNAQVGRKNLTAVLDSEDEDTEILGFCMMSTTGGWIYAPRDGLKEQFSRFGISHRLLPREVRPWMAYSRMTNELVNSDNDEEYTTVTGHEEQLEVTFRLEDGDEKYYHLYADVFYPESIIGEDGGEHNAVKILTLNYYPESERIATDPQIEKGTPLWDFCLDFMSRAQQLFNKHQSCHDGNDMRNVINDFRSQGVNTVRFRNGCYFIGAHYQEEVEGMAEIWSWLNEHKTRGQRCEIMTIPVVDSEKQREQVERLARQKTEDMVDEAIEAALDDLTDESNAEHLAESIVDEVSEAESFAEEYNMLLEAEMSVKEVLKDRRDNLEDDKSEIVDSVLEKLD